MLVLTRRPGEEIHIGNDIKIFITGVYGNQVRVGIEAPKDVNITRPDAVLKTQRTPQKNASLKSMWP